MAGQLTLDDAGDGLSDQWAEPGSRSSQPTAVGPSASRLSQRNILEPSSTTPRPLPMRPQSLIEVLDSGFALVRSAPMLVFSIVAVFDIPVAVLSAYLRHDALSVDNQLIFGDPTLANQGFGSAMVASAVSFLAGSLIQTIAGVAMGMVVVAWYSDREPDIAGILGKLARRIHWVVLAWFLVHLLELVGLIGIGIGAFLAACLLVVVGPVMAVEDIGPVASIRRSVRLVRGRYAPTMLFFVLSGIIATVLGSIMGGLPTVLGLLLGVNGGWILVAVGGIISGIVSTSFLAAATVAFYFDLRVRREAIDLHLEMVDRFPQ